MGESRLTDRHINTIWWGMLLVWWGICFLPGVLPNGVDAAGTGVILLSASIVRRARGKSMDAFTLIAGTLCLIWGALDMTRSVLHMAWHLPVLAILLVAFGVELLAVAVLHSARARKQQPGEPTRAGS